MIHHIILPAKPLLRQLRLPSIAEMIRQESASMVYKAINGQVPPYLSSLFNNISAVTNRMLRTSCLNLRSPRMTTKFRHNSFAYRGAKIWKSLPNDRRKAHTFPTFKEKLKAMIAWHHLLFSLSFVLPFFFIYYRLVFYLVLYMYSFLKEDPLKTSFAEG